MKDLGEVSRSAKIQDKTTSNAKRKTVLPIARGFNALWTLMVVLCITFGGNIATAATATSTAKALPARATGRSIVSPLITVHVSPADKLKYHSGGARGKAQISASYDQLSNWAGYIDKNTPSNLNYVYSDWVVPSLSCESSHDAKALVWVGIGGKNSTDPLYQNGIGMDCSSGTASYYDWYEEVPGAGFTKYPWSHAIYPGDKIVAFAEPTSYGAYLFVEDFSSVSASSFNWLDQVSISDSAAHPKWVECIAERPTILDNSGNFAGLWDLANFDYINFSTDSSPSFHKACDVASGGTDHIISSTSSGLSGSDLYQVDMWDSALSLPIAGTDSPSSSGAFNVYWDMYN